MYDPPLSADEESVSKDDREGDSDDRSEAAVVEAKLPCTSKSSEVSPDVTGTGLDSQEPLSTPMTSIRGSPRSVSDKEQLPALLISGRVASRSVEVPDKVAVVDSAAAADATKTGSPTLVESSVDASLQPEGQVGQALQSLDEPPAATVPVEEQTGGGGSPQQWPGIDMDSLHHISNMNLRPPRSRRTRQQTGRSSSKHSESVSRGASGTPRKRGSARSSGGSNGGVLPSLAAGAMGKRVEELLLW